MIPKSPKNPSSRPLSGHMVLLACSIMPSTLIIRWTIWAPPDLMFPSMLFWLLAFCPKILVRLLSCSTICLRGMGFCPTSIHIGNREMGSPECAMERLKKMEDKGIEISAVIYTTMMNAFYKKGRNEEAEKLWNEMMKSGCPLDVATYNVRIMNIYGRDPEAVKGNFCKPNAATFRTLIFHLCKKQV